MSSDESILFANNYSYKLPTPTSVVTNRVLKRQYFQQRSYSEGQTAICQFNTGVDYVDLQNSSLFIKVKVNSKVGVVDPWRASFGQGSACNILKNIRIYHRSGTPYTNSQRVNLWRKLTDKYTHSPHWFGTVGKLMGYDGEEKQFERTTNERVDFLIPMCKVHPFFDPEGQVHLPANMASGLRVELDLASLAEAFFNEPGGGFPEQPGSYEIEDIYFETMNITLMDSAQASLNTLAQKSSLEYVYKDLFTSQNSQSANSSQINVDVNKSVSFADTVMAVLQDQTSIQAIDKDSFKSIFAKSKYDYTLGSQHYPNVKVDTEKQAYNNALISFDKLKHSTKETSVSFTDFATGGGWGVYAQSLERDTSLALSQSPINASRSLRFELTYDVAPTTNQICTIFLTYLTSCRSTLLNSRVDI